MKKIFYKEIHKDNFISYYLIKVVALTIVITLIVENFSWCSKKNCNLNIKNIENVSKTVFCLKQQEQEIPSNNLIYKNSVEKLTEYSVLKSGIFVSDFPTESIVTVQLIIIDEVNDLNDITVSDKENSDKFKVLNPANLSKTDPLKTDIVNTISNDNEKIDEDIEAPNESDLLEKKQEIIEPKLIDEEQENIEPDSIDEEQEITDTDLINDEEENIEPDSIDKEREVTDLCLLDNKQSTEPSVLTKETDLETDELSEEEKDILNEGNVKHNLQIATEVIRVISGVVVIVAVIILTVCLLKEVIASFLIRRGFISVERWYIRTHYNLHAYSIGGEENIGVLDLILSRSRLSNSQSIADSFKYRVNNNGQVFENSRGRYIGTTKEIFPDGYNSIDDYFDNNSEILRNHINEIYS